jgi:putative ABC transport system permease protein
VLQEKLQKDVDATINNYLSKNCRSNYFFFKRPRKQRQSFYYHATPVTDIHLHSNKSYEMETNGNLLCLYFSIIAIFPFLIACVNFMNLSTARSANRAKKWE